MDIQEFKENGKLLIGACGSISVVNIFSWIIYLKSNFCNNIQVIMTKQASTMVNPSMVSLFSGKTTHVTFFDDGDFPAPHVSLTNWASLFLVLPASANMIGKCANGIADDLLSSAIMAARCPTVFIPSMNIDMWEKKIVQDNVKKLKEFGYHVVFDKSSGYKIATNTMEEGTGVDLQALTIKLFRILNSNCRSED